MIDLLRTWWRRRQAARLAIPPSLWQEVESGLPLLARLTASERRRLRQLAREFVVSKEWTGAAELQLTPHIQLAIALQACLLVLNLDLDFYAGWVGIVVYPGDFHTPRQRVDEAGVVHEFDETLLGEAWAGGPVLVSWFDAPEALDGINPVIHEFAHQIDMKNGRADGLPPLHGDMSVARWGTAMNSAFADLRQRLEHGHGTAIDPYAAESPAEFFAVVSEVFFETPRILRNAYPQVFAQLALFYRQHPE